jgi:hypothetical protein
MRRGRQVTAYVSPSSPEAIDSDGELLAWGGFLEVAHLPPTMIIGARRVDDEALRIREYSPGGEQGRPRFDPDRFATHGPAVLTGHRHGRPPSTSFDAC